MSVELMYWWKPYAVVLNSELGALVDRVWTTGNYGKRVYLTVFLL